MVPGPGPGTLVPWHRGTIVAWYHAATVRWHYVWHHDTMVTRHNGTMLKLYHCTMVRSVETILHHLELICGHPAPIEFNIDSSRINPMDLRSMLKFRRKSNFSKCGCPVPSPDPLASMPLPPALCRSCFHFGCHGEGARNINKFDLNRVKRVPVFAKKKPMKQIIVRCPPPPPQFQC